MYNLPSFNKYTNIKFTNGTPNFNAIIDFLESIYPEKLNKLYTFS